MTDRSRLQMFLHGGILLLIGSFLGVPFFVTLTEGGGEQAVQFWRSAHTGITSAGVWVLATGAASLLLKLTERTGWLLAWSTIGSNYAVLAVLLIKAVAGEHDATRVALFGPAYAFYVLAGAIAAILAFVSVVVLMIGAQAGLRHARRTN